MEDLAEAEASLERLAEAEPEVALAALADRLRSSA